MKNGLLYLLAGGLIGYFGYRYYLQYKKDQKKIGKKNNDNIDVEKTEVPIEDIVVVNTPIIKKPIFNPKMVKDYDINKQPAQPHLVIYQGVSAPKPELKTSDFVVNKNVPEINYSWLM